MTILKEAYPSLIIIEHDPILYDDSLMVEYISKAMRQALQEATVLLFSPDIDPFLEDLAKGQIVCSTSKKKATRLAQAAC